MIVDRKAELRKDQAALTEARARARVLPIWRNRSLVTGDRPPKPIALEGAAARAALDAGEHPVFLGVDGSGAPVFAVDLSAIDDPSSLGIEGRFQDLRMAGAFMATPDFEPLAYARGITRWNRKTNHCAECGGALTTEDAGFAKICSQCETRTFPRTDPAVMVLVVREDRALLARQHGFPKGMYSALAGFVEPGESLEQCVHREVGEEVGLSVRRLRYHDSQGWPFPRSLMIGYLAEAGPGDVVLEEEELEEARWFSKDELRSPKGFFYPPPMSLAHHLVKSWLG
ncbi:MAG: NAD(+) diphosphatase [Deltaproteobacteria bacterium]|nr:NAD(+) diphosphatase [Deltaproteobacteria bacterium]